MNTKFQFRAGLRYAKKPSLYEIAHIVEHLAFGANSEFRDEQEFESEFTKNGAYHNAWTSDFSVCYESECADFEWDRIMYLQQVAIAEPRFNDEELQSEKGNVRAELTGYMNDYNRLLWPRLQQVVGENVPTCKNALKLFPISPSKTSASITVAPTPPTTYALSLLAIFVIAVAKSSKC